MAEKDAILVDFYINSKWSLIVQWILVISIYKIQLRYIIRTLARAISAISICLKNSVNGGMFLSKLYANTRLKVLFFLVHIELQLDYLAYTYFG